MHTVKVPDLADGPVRIRHGGLEPIELEAQGGLITGVAPEHLNSVRTAFPEAVVLDAADGFRPSDHSVDEVNSYLADADPETVAAVLAAEAADKNRKGIVDGPYATPEV